jgi:hypothetical protein
MMDLSVRREAQKPVESFENMAFGIAFQMANKKRI